MLRHPKIVLIHLPKNLENLRYNDYLDEWLKKLAQLKYRLFDCHVGQVIEADE